MDKVEWIAFLGWLDSASDEELHSKKGRLDDLLAQLHDVDVKRDVRSMIRQIDLEQIARLELR